MSLLGRIGSLLVLSWFCLTGWVFAQQPAKPLPPLTEVKLLGLIEEQIEEPSIINRIKKGGIAFVPDEACIARLTKGGATPPILAAVRDAGKALSSAAAGRIMIWSSVWAGDTNHFSSEVSINQVKVGDFKGETKQEIQLKTGWNDITVTTTPTEPKRKCHGLTLHIGGVEEKKPGELEMTRPLWSFLNANGWQFQDGAYIHDFGPRTKEATVTFKVYYAGLNQEKVAIADDDYVLQSNSNPYQTDGTSATVYVNGNPVNTFFNTERQVVITPFLKRGALNQIRVVTHRVKDGTYGGAQSFKILGPMEYDGQRKDWTGNVMMAFWDQTGWKRNAKTQLMVYSEDPAAESSEDEHSLFIEPLASDSANGNKPRLTLRTRTEPYDRNCLVSDIKINGQDLGRFSVETKRKLEGILQPGWNEVQITTIPLKPSVNCNGLILSIGWEKDDEEHGGEVMVHPLWGFRSHKGWRYEDGKQIHDSGEKPQGVELSFRVFLGSIEQEKRKPAAGDYLLQVNSSIYDGDPVTASVTINGQPVTTFFNTDRSVVITPFLKPGKNELRLVYHRVKNNTYGDHQTFTVIGPLKPNAAQKTLTGEKVLDFKSLLGWERVPETQQLIYKNQPALEKSEEVYTFDKL